MREDIPDEDVDREALITYLQAEIDFYEAIHRDAGEPTKAAAYAKGRVQSYADVLSWALAREDLNTRD